MGKRIADSAIDLCQCIATPAAAPAQVIPEPALDLMLLTKMDPTSIRFAATMDALNASYDTRPVPFSVGATHSEAGQNNGSALIISFAKHVGLTKDEALALFGEHYASVRAEPEGTSHSNIRSFMAGGFACVSFPEGLAIINKADTDSGSDSGDEAAGGAAEEAVLAELAAGQPAAGLSPPTAAAPARPCTLEYPLYGKRGTKRVLEYSRLAMRFAHVRASRYGIR